MDHSLLLVEDEPYIRELISHTLRGAGHRVHEAVDGPSALRLLESERVDLVVLDIRLPGMDGWEVCRQIRARRELPVLFLSALDSEDAVVRGLRLGDDYLTKPFSPAILAARVQALLRRASPLATRQQLVRLKGLSVNLASAEVRRGDQPVRLTPTEFRVLATLARSSGQIVAATEIMRAAQGYDLPQAEAQDIVKVHVRHLRQKIEPDPVHPRYVLTVRSMGYMLNPDELEDDA